MDTPEERGGRQIGRIEMKGMLPRVFVSEKIPPSDVWRHDVAF